MQGNFGVSSMIVIVSITMVVGATLQGEVHRKDVSNAADFFVVDFLEI